MMLCGFSASVVEPFSLCCSSQSPFIQTTQVGGPLCVRPLFGVFLITPLSVSCRPLFVKRFVLR